MAQDYDPVTPLLILSGKEGSPQRRLHSEHVQVVRRHQRAFESFGFSTAGQVDRHCLRDRRRKLGEALALLPLVEKIRRSHALLFIVAHPSRKPHKPLRLDKGSRTQQHSVHDAEDGCVGPDAQREREHGHGGEARVL